MDKNNLRFGVVSQSAVVREGLCTILRNHGHQAVQISGQSLRTRSIGNVVLHAILVDISGPNSCESLIDRFIEQTSGTIPVITFSDKKINNRSVSITGANGEEEIVRRAVIGAMRGQVDVETYSKEKLTRRERDVYILLSQGLSNTSIAQKLNVSVKTIESHKENMKQKLHLDTNDQLRMTAIRASRSPDSI